MHNPVYTAAARFPAANDLMGALPSALQTPPAVPVSGSGELETRLQHFQKTAALGRAALGVAHEFNNLLGVIAGYAELLEVNPILDEPARGEAAEIRKAAGRAAALAQQLLNFGRRTAAPDGRGRKEGEETREESASATDLGGVVRGIRQILHCLVGSNVRLVVVSGPEPCLVRVGAGPVEQVLMNLVVNARDALAAAASPAGQVMVATGAVRLEQACRHAHGVLPPGNYGRLVVSDTGCGMDAATQARLFEPFYTTKDPGKGTGLGMAIVAALLNQTGGHITLWSERGRGTRFEVYWPQYATTGVIADPGTCMGERGQS